MYGKLFEQMYNGTLGTKGPWQALVTFQQMIILADKHGIVDMTAEVIAKRSTIPLEIITEGIRCLQLPDPGSRTPTEEGRRITLLDPARDWGWRIVNHEHYRKMRSEEERREYMRNYQRTRRETEKTARVNDVNTASTPVNNVTHAVSSKQEALNPPPPLSKSTSKPKPMTKAEAKAQALIAEQRAWQAAPMPDNLVPRKPADALD